MTHVLIPDYPTRLQFSVGATPTSAFAFNFTFFQNSDIHVFFDGNEGGLGVDFVVTGVPGTEGGFAGGTVNTTVAVVNRTITIMRIMAIERVSDFPDAGSFNRRTLNTTLDKHVAMIQQVDERVDRAIVLPPTGINTPAAIANAFLQGDPTGTFYELLTPAQVRSEIAAQPADATLTALAALSVSVDTLPYATGAESFALTALTAYARSILDDLDAIAMRATLGLGTMATQNANAVAITGGTISGVAITVPGIGSMAYQNADAVAITGGTITGMPIPTNFSDVATKAYADNLAFGVNKRSTVRVASTANLTLASVGSGTVVDGVALASTDRLLVKDQTNHAENGVYLVGVSATSLRAADFDTYDENPGSLVTIQEGTVNQDTVYLCTSNSGGTLGTTAIDFSKVKVSPNIPVVIAEGGTGQTTALAAFNALKQNATSGYLGVMQIATQAEVDGLVDTTKAVVPVTLQKRMVDILNAEHAYADGRNTRHDCRFDYISPGIVRLNRYGGSLITIDGQLRTIPAAGVDFPYTLFGGAGQMAWIYAQWSGGVISFVPDVVAPALDPRDGNLVHPSGSWLTVVGMVVSGYGTYLSNLQQIGVISYWNRRTISAQSFVSSVASGSTTPVNLTNGCYFVNFGDEPVTVAFAGYATNNTPGIAATITQIALDGGAWAFTQNHTTVAGAAANHTLSMSGMTPPGWRQFTPQGYVGSGVATWGGALTMTTRG